MNEPNYEYIKGEGWVLETTKTELDFFGKKVRFEIRKPEAHEHYMRFEGVEDESFIRARIKSRSYKAWHRRGFNSNFDLTNYFVVVLTMVYDGT